jgi:cytochrome c biogenesis protein CcmG/thiol:disulfide interchange protein DsbE
LFNRERQVLLMETPVPPANLSRRVLLHGGLLLFGLGGCRAVADANLPAIDLPPIEGLRRMGWPVPGLTADVFGGRPTLLNVWATWCGYCRSEHPFLLKLAEQRRFNLVGLAVSDTAANVRAYLREKGNPYRAISLDESGALGRRLGARGVPNTLAVNAERQIVARLPGVISDERIARDVLPRLAV